MSLRTLDQNKYLHAVPLRRLADRLELSVPETKTLVLGECFGWHVDTATGELVPLKPHTSALTVEECAALIEWIPRWAWATHRFDIPLPMKPEDFAEVA